MAIWHGHPDVVKFLVEAERKAFGYDQDETWDRFFDEYPRVLPRPKPTILACCVGRVEVLRYFVEELNISVDETWDRDPYKGSMLLAAMRGFQTSFVDESDKARRLQCMEYLLDHGADIFSTIQSLQSDLTDTFDHFFTLALTAWKRGSDLRWIRWGDRSLYPVEDFGIYMGPTHIDVRAIGGIGYRDTVYEVGTLPELGALYRRFFFSFFRKLSKF